MIAARVRGGLLILCLAGGSCRDAPASQVAVEAKGNGYVLDLRVRPIEGLCYAPGTIRFNGSLSLPSFGRSNSWKLVRTDPRRVGGLDEILSAERVRIGRGALSLVVQRDQVMQQPSFLQFVAFPCDAPRRSAGLTGPVAIVSVAADLAPFHYSRRR
jgi:hypothetical protein